MSVQGLILFGDSVLLGTGASQHQLGCGSLLESKLNIPVLIKAMGGDTTREGLNRLRKDVLTQKGYSHVVVLFGNNDARWIRLNKAVVPLKDYMHNLGRIIRQIQASHKKPMLCNLQPIDNDAFFNIFPKLRKYISVANITPYEWHKKYSEACEDIAREYKIQLIDIRNALEKQKEKVISKDGLHPNNRGHQIIAETIAKELGINFEEV